MLLGEFKMRLGLVMLSMFLLAGCSKTMGTAETNLAACSVWRDISWSSKDTPQTITEVKVNNARREGYCKGEK
jgi:outer membrane murein-binding lipoprotein Lpp